MCVSVSECGERAASFGVFSSIRLSLLQRRRSGLAGSVVVLGALLHVPLVRRVIRNSAVASVLRLCALNWRLR